MHSLVHLIHYNGDVKSASPMDGRPSRRQMEGS